ncbi:MAG: FHA domain-containing protein [Syntrophaceae bacterium]|nr:FHA domain-containing protein [Syntrophaceae bacterium]
MLYDHLHREAADYEAYNLLIKAFYETGRYEAAIELIEVVLMEHTENNCFENNLLLCSILLGKSLKEPPQIRDRENPFLNYNWSIYKEKPAAWNSVNDGTLKSKLIFQNFRYGINRNPKPNTLTIEQEDLGSRKFEDSIICIGRSAANHVILHEISVSRRHCVLINYPGDVWLYDLGSTHGTYVDDIPVNRPVFLERRCRVSIAGHELTVLPRDAMLF